MERSFHFHVSVAETNEHIGACKRIIAEVYETEYGVKFHDDDDQCNPDHMIEPWPHRFMMGTVDGNVVAAGGLFVRSNTYVWRYGKITHDDVNRVIEEASQGHRYHSHRQVELAKTTALKRWRRYGLATALARASLSREFLEIDPHPEGDSLVICCGKHSIWEGLWKKKAGCTTRHVKPFPHYKAHEKYRNGEPMDSRIMLPATDIPPDWHALKLPVTFRVFKAAEDDWQSECIGQGRSQQSPRVATGG